MVAAHSSPPKWGTVKRTAMLFLTFYCAFLMFDFTSSDELFPHFVYTFFKPYAAFWDWLVPFTGKHILYINYPVTVKPNGSADTTYNYVMQFLWLTVAPIIAFTWVAIDRKRIHYSNLYYWLRIFIRYYLAYILFFYGFIKIIKLQFPAPNLVRLMQPYGESSPMGLAWSFIGYSTGYNYFIGGAEVSAGLLLFFKRTTLLGSLLAMVVMCNVAAMNFAYDIPVKIFSLNLVILAVILVLYDWNRIRNLFFLNIAAPPYNIPIPQPESWTLLLQRSLKLIAIGFTLYATLYSSWVNRRKFGDLAPKPPLYGIYNVTTFTRNAHEIPPLTTDTSRWKQMVINNPKTVRIINMSDSVVRMKLDLDTLKHIALFTDNKDSTITYQFKYNWPEHGRLVFTGRVGKDSNIIDMKRFDETQFRLQKTGFHWINEYPYNR